MSNEKSSQCELVDSKSIKIPYFSPTLVTYGAVALLTAGSNCSAPNDANGSCPSSGGNSMGMISDLRAKENIVRIGEHPLGFGLYLFNYISEFRDQCGHGRQFGVIAQEVETFVSEAVLFHPSGYKMVNYAMLGISHTVH